MPYTVDFENDGSAAAQDVTVTEQLDPNLDWSTFQLGSFGFGPVNVTIPAGLTQYQTTVGYQNTDGTPLNVLVALDFNVQTGLLTATFTSLDPLTGQAPTGVFDGFLPPTTAAASARASSSTPCSRRPAWPPARTINSAGRGRLRHQRALATETFSNTIVGASTCLTNTTKQKAYTAVEGNN